MKIWKNQKGVISMSATTQIAALTIAILDISVLILALCRTSKVEVKWYEMLLGLSALLLLILALP